MGDDMSFKDHRLPTAGHKHKWVDLGRKLSPEGESIMFLEVAVSNSLLLMYDWRMSLVMPT